MKKLSFILILYILVSGCYRDTIVDSETPALQGSPKNGLFILCEGNSNNGSSELGFYNFDSVLTRSIFNPGLYPVGMIYDGNNILITEQGDLSNNGKIYRIDTAGKVLASQVIGTNPYSLCISNNKIYVTNFSIGKVSVCDFNSLSVIKTIYVGVYPKEILSFNNKVFVCNEGNDKGFQDSSVYVIDAINDVVVDTIFLDKSPSSIVLGKDNKLLVGCRGAEGKIFKVDPVSDIVLDAYGVVNGFDKDISVDMNTNNIYFISYTNSIIQLNLSTRASQTVIYNANTAINNFYGYIFDYKRRNHYIANALNSNDPGYLHKYDEIGTYPPITLQTGLNPRRFLFLENQ